MRKQAVVLHCTPVYMHIDYYGDGCAIYELGLKLSYWEIGWLSLVGTFHYYS